MYILCNYDHRLHGIHGKGSDNWCVGKPIKPISDVMVFMAKVLTIDV